MGKKLSSILLTIIFLTLATTNITHANQTPNYNSFFSFFKNSLITYISNTSNQNEVLAAQTAPTVIQPIPTQAPQAPVIPPQNTQLSQVSSYILNGVNAYRSSLGLSPVTSTSETCNFAQTRAQEISNSFNHTGFYNRVNSHTLPYAQWSHATENIAQAPDYKEVVTLWENSPEHAANMRDNTPFVCIMQYQSYYAYEGMRL
jgi:uncharacterized protein YkwD